MGMLEGIKRIKPRDYRRDKAIFKEFGANYLDSEQRQFLDQLDEDIRKAGDSLERAKGKVKGEMR